MKKHFIVMLVIVTSFLFISSSQIFGQVSDTLVLAANPIPGSGPTIDQQIMGDTTSTGARKDPNRVYVLQQTGSLDTVYFIGSTIYSNYKLTIIGKPNPVTGMLPIIAPALNANNTSPSQLIVAQGGSVTLKNLYFMFKNIAGTAITNQAIETVGDSITISADHCTFDGFEQSNKYVFFNNGNWGKLFITNCDFRNFQCSTTGNGGVSWSNGKVPLDTLVIKNSTIFCNHGELTGGPGYFNYIDIDHNTLFFLSDEVIKAREVTNAVIKNNIFFGVSLTGADTNSYVNQAHEGSFISNQLFGFDSLATTKNPPYNKTEADRNITIENNDYFWPPAIISNLDTMHTDTGSAVVPPKWMDPFVDSMFTDKNEWPKCMAQNNLTVDPGFSASYVNTAVDSIILYQDEYWAKGSSNHFWNIYADDPYTVYNVPGHAVPKDWASIGPYPVPENLRYTNTALQHAGTDGKALGDLNWFPEQLTDVQQVSSNIPAKFELSQNYPNPFNPTTIIHYSITKSGFVSL